MLYWAAVFFIIAIIAAVLGFTGIALAAAAIARILFFIFLVFFVVALIGGLLRRRTKILQVQTLAPELAMIRKLRSGEYRLSKVSSRSRS